MIPENTMLLSVVTPSGTIVEEPVVSVALWTTMGEIEALRGHAPTVVLLEPGEMRLRGPDGNERAFAAGEGFAQIDQQSVTVFSDMAEPADGIACKNPGNAPAQAGGAEGLKRCSIPGCASD
jgi:F-type H+-transporting ATPase subunit epsilon